MEQAIQPNQNAMLVNGWKNWRVFVTLHKQLSEVLLAGVSLVQWRIADERKAEHMHRFFEKILHGEFQTKMLINHKRLAIKRALMMTHQIKSPFINQSDFLSIQKNFRWQILSLRFRRVSMNCHNVWIYLYTYHVLQTQTTNRKQVKIFGFYLYLIKNISCGGEWNDLISCDLIKLNC